MTRHIADSENLDHVTILFGRVCSARLDATVSYDDFTRIVARLLDVAVAEAVEDHEEPPIATGDEIPACRYCRSLLLDGIEHWCASLSPTFRQFTRATVSTGAPRAESSAEQSSDRAASEARAEPSKSLNDIPRNIPAAASVSAQASAAPHTPPSEPESPGAAPSRLSESAAATSAEAPRARARGGPQPRIDEAKRQRIRERYAEVAAENPSMARNAVALLVAKEMGVGVSTVHRFAGVYDKRPESVPELAGRSVHTHSHGCFCRKAPNTVANRWCSNNAAAPLGPIKTLAGQQEGPSYRRPRN